MRSMSAVEPELDTARRKAKQEVRGQETQDLYEVKDQVYLE